MSVLGVQRPALSSSDIDFTFTDLRLDNVRISLKGGCKHSLIGILLCDLRSTFNFWTCFIQWLSTFMAGRRQSTSVSFCLS